MSDVVSRFGPNLFVLPKRTAHKTPTFVIPKHERITLSVCMLSANLAVSLSVLCVVALLSETSSPYMGRIIATAPTGTSLALFLSSRVPASASVVDPAAGAAETQRRLVAATEGLVHGTVSTLLFAVLARTSAASGYGLWATLAAGFSGWAAALFLLGRLS